MNRLRAWIVAFFGFSRSETNAFLIMLPLMVLLAFSAPLYSLWHRADPSSDEDKRMLDSLIATWHWEKEAAPKSESHDTVFVFDPNTATQHDFVQLGLSEKLSKRIVHFREKGGKFKIKKDFGKVYGLDTLTLSKLYPFIKLPEQMKLQTVAFAARRATRTSPLRFDLNLTDTTQLIKIYGIGQKRARSIIKYRDRLGGFISMDQLHEVFGLDSAVIDTLKNQSFISDQFTPRQLNINTADEKSLKSLPYIRFALAKSIAVYRFQHGPFDSIEALKHVALIDKNTFQKIKPYITLKDSL